MVGQLAIRSLAALAVLTATLVVAQRLWVNAYWETHPEEHRSALLLEAKYPLEQVRAQAQQIASRRVAATQPKKSIFDELQEQQKRIQNEAIDKLLDQPVAATPATVKPAN